METYVRLPIGCGTLSNAIMNKKVIVSLNTV